MGEKTGMEWKEIATPVYGLLHYIVLRFRKRLRIWMCWGLWWLGLLFKLQSMYGGGRRLWWWMGMPWQIDMWGWQLWQQYGLGNGLLCSSLEMPLLGGVLKLRWGVFNKYVDQNVPNFDYLSPLSEQLWTCDIHCSHDQINHLPTSSWPRSCWMPFWPNFLCIDIWQPINPQLIFL